MISNVQNHNLIVKILRVFVLPILFFVPAIVFKNFMLVSSGDSNIVQKRGGSSLAVETMYTGVDIKNRKQNKIVNFFWYNIISQPKALKNRLIFVQRFLTEEISERMFGNKGDNLTIVSLGSGIGSSVSNSLVEIFKGKIINNIKVINIDLDGRAIEVGKNEAEKRKLDKITRWVNGDFNDVNNIVEPGTVNIVEAVGILDYLTDEELIIFVKKIFISLCDGGALITANVHPNAEIFLVRKSGWPKMYYRHANDFLLLLRKAGFKGQNEFVVEPLGCHSIVKIKK